jgi:hypothetical protein
VFTARYGLSPYIKQIRLVFEDLKLGGRADVNSVDDLRLS